MAPIDPASAREFLEAVVTAFSVLGGCMAYVSGQRAADALMHGASPESIGHSISEGIALGFLGGAPGAVLALMIMVWN